VYPYANDSIPRKRPRSEPSESRQSGLPVRCSVLRTVSMALSAGGLKDTKVVMVQDLTEVVVPTTQLPTSG